MSNQINFVSGMLKNAGSLGVRGSAFEGSPAHETGKAIGRGFDNVWNGVGQMGSAAAQGARNVGNAAVQGVQNAGSAVAQGARNVGNAAVQGAKNVAGGIADTASDAVQGVQNAGSAVAQRARNVGNAAVQGAQNVGNAAVQGAKNVGNAVVGAGQDASDYAYRHTRGTAFDGSPLDRAVNPRDESYSGSGGSFESKPSATEGAVGMPNGPTATPAAPPSLSITTGVEQGSPTMGFNSNPTPAAPAASSQPYGTDAMGQTNPDTAKRFGQAVAPAAPAAPYTDPRENRANTTIPRPAAATPPAGRYPNASSAAPSGQNDLFKKYHGTSYDPNSTEDKSKMQALQASKGNPAKTLQTANAFPLHKRASAYPGF